MADGDRWVKYEDTLIGNTEGLLRLCEHVDEALRTGAAEVTEPGIEFGKIRIVDADPRDARTSWVRDKARMLLYVLIVLLFALGLKEISDWFR